MSGPEESLESLLKELLNLKPSLSEKEEKKRVQKVLPVRFPSSL